VGAGEAGDRLISLAEQTGAELARRGAVLVCGGLGGVMEAASRGAREAGGTTVALLPGHDRRDANAYSDIVVTTGLGEARNVLIVRAADVLIAIGGEFGTLSEIAFALKIGKPVVSLESWDLEKAGAPRGSIVQAGSPSEAVDLAWKLAARP
jgi:uncharacterized protein (TIGR00725 family)